jgi:hypothetical protein
MILGSDDRQWTHQVAHVELVLGHRYHSGGI